MLLRTLGDVDPKPTSRTSDTGFAGGGQIRLIH
jgi:hypothetical protein